MKSMVWLCIGFMLYLMLGCVTTRYGDFSDLNNSQLTNISDETVGYMKSIWLPAKTKLLFMRSKKPGTFDQVFVDKLRNAGYQVQEIDDRPVGEGIGREIGLMPAHDDYLPVKYIVDRDDYEGRVVYSVMVFVGSDIVGGTFCITNGNDLHQLGVWTHKSSGLITGTR
jgi:hypothetical protein